MDVLKRIGVSEEGTGKRLLEQIKRKREDIPVLLPNDTSEEGLERTCKMIHNIFFYTCTRNQVISSMYSIAVCSTRTVHIPRELWDHIEFYGSLQNVMLGEQEEEWTLVPSSHPVNPPSPSKFSPFACFIKRYVQRLCNSKIPVLLLCDHNVVELLVTS